MDRRTASALITVQVLYGLLPVAGKLAFVYVDPLPLTAVRTLGGALILWLLRPILRTSPVPWRKEGWTIAGLAVLGVMINMGLFAVGLEMTTAVHATLLVTTIPVFTYLGAVLLGKETLGKRRAAGILLAFLGVVVLVGVGSLEGGMRQVIGDVLIAINSLSFGLFLVLSKPAAARIGPLALSTGLLTVAAVVFVPIGLLTGLPAQLAATPTSTLWVLAFIVLGPTAAVYVLNARALRSVPASTVAVFIYLQPILAASTAALILGEELSWRIVPAAVLVFAGVWLVARRKREKGKGIEQA